MVIWKICIAARTEGAKYLEELMRVGDVIQDDLVQMHQFALNRARCNVDGNHGAKLNTYISKNPNETVHSMYMRKVVYRIETGWCATRLRLSSHSLAIETGRWSRIPRDSAKWSSSDRRTCNLFLRYESACTLSISVCCCGIYEYC